MTPKIRFNDFSDEWKGHPFEEVAKRISTSKYDESIPCVEYEDIDSKSGKLNKDVTKKTVHKRGQFFETGDILFGKLRPYLHNNYQADFDGIAVGDFWIFKNGMAVTSFIYPFISSREFSYVSNLSVGSKMPRSDWGLVSSWKFHIPENKQEQIRIGQYFKHLDLQISNIGKELQKLRQLKAASLQAMFPQEGETAPRLRFKGFEGEWKFNTISSVLELRRGLTYTPNDMCDKNEGVLVLRSSNINGDTFHKDENDVYVRPAAVNIPLIKRGDLLFTAANGSSNLVGKHCIIPDIKTPAVPGGFMLVGKSENPYFLQAYFSAPWYQKALPSFIMGGNGSLGNLKVSDLLSHRLLFPEDTQEAEKIAIFFLNLDKQIKLTEEKLEKLRQIKASCLDLMFV